MVSSTEGPRFFHPVTPEIMRTSRKNKATARRRVMPWAVLLNLPFEGEHERDAGGENPQNRIRGRSEGVGGRGSRSLLEVTEYCRCQAERRRKRRRCKSVRPLDAAWHKAGAGDPKTAWPEQKGARTSQTVRQQPPLERLVVLPDRVGYIDEKALVVLENVRDHQADERKQQVALRPRDELERHGSSRHRDP